MKFVSVFSSTVILSLVARADFEVYFLRHGETTWNRAHVLQGSLSYPRLTLRGERMAAATAEGMVCAGIGFDRVYTSPLGRARQTAEFIVDGLRLPKATCDTRLREMGFGKYEGLRYEKGHWQDDNLRRFFEDLERYVPTGDGAESLEQVQVRLRGFLVEAVDMFVAAALSGASRIQMGAMMAEGRGRGHLREVKGQSVDTPLSRISPIIDQDNGLV